MGCMVECGGVFSSNLCCLAPLNWFVIAEEDEEGVVDAEEDCILAEADATVEADARLSCSREWAVDKRAKSTLGGSGREEEDRREDEPDKKPRAKPSGTLTLPLTAKGSSSSARRFLRLCTATSPDPDWFCSDRAGGSRESDSSGFCSRWRKKWALRFPRVVKRLRQTGHWYGLSPVWDLR